MKRYRAGKLPVWANQGEDEEEEQQGGGDLLRTTRKRKFGGDFLFQVQGKEDARLCRLADNQLETNEKKKNEIRSFHRAEILSTTPDLVDEEEDEDVLEEKRHRLREKILRQQEEKESLLFQEEEDDESEYETTDSEVEESVVGMLEKKPIYVPKSEWDTIADRERMEAKECDMKNSRAKERELETKQILVSLIQQEEDNNNDNYYIVDEDFNGKEEEESEYVAWKLRETLRMRRDKVGEKEENMSPNSLPRKSKKKWRFMQKYYHKGAFFQSTDDDLYARDFSAPTGEDKMDKTLLPKVMQVKYFGRMGRTKWTHLLNEDTT